MARAVARAPPGLGGRGRRRSAADLSRAIAGRVWHSAGGDLRGRTRKDFPLDDDLAALTELHVTTEDGSRGHQGRVTDTLESLLGEDAEVFTCGPDRMMAAVAAICARRDVPCEVSVETPMACGYGVCLGCPLPANGGGYIYACTEGPCIDARRIDWSRGERSPRPGGQP